MTPPIEKKIRASGIIAVVVIDRLESAESLAESLLAGGITVVELTLRTQAAMLTLARIKKAFPEMLVGAGTVLTRDQMREARDNGAEFGVAPGVNPHVLAAAREEGFPFAPGVATPSDIEIAVEHGCRLLKFFPAEQLGGLPYLKAIGAPYAHLNLSYIPLGGLNEASITPYLSDPMIAALGGSWVASRELINSGNWRRISALCAKAVQTVQSIRS